MWGIIARKPTLVNPTNVLFFYEFGAVRGRELAGLVGGACWGYSVYSQGASERSSPRYRTRYGKGWCRGQLTLATRGVRRERRLLSIMLYST